METPRIKLPPGTHIAFSLPNDDTVFVGEESNITLLQEVDRELPE
jgi:hypothetical protein